MRRARTGRWLGLVLTIGMLLMARGASAQLRLESDDAQIDLRGRVQAGFNHRFVDDEDYDKTRFYLGQTRLQLDAQIFDVFFAQIDFDLRAAEGYPEAKDLWIAWQPAPFFELKLGQFKVPVSRNRLASGGRLLFASRPRVTDEFVPGRDIGLLTTLSLAGGRYRLRTGAFVGRGPNTTEDDERGHPLVAMRFDAAPLGMLDGGEGDVARTPGFRFSIGINGAYSHDAGPALEDGLPNALHSIDGHKVLVGGDLALKYRGLFVSGELLFARYYPTVGADYSAAGFLVQVAYFIHRLRLEPALRFHSLNPSDLLQDDRETTLDVGLNFYPLRTHRAKVLLNYSHHFKDDPAPEAWKDDRVRVMVQLAFK